MKITVVFDVVTQVWPGRRVSGTRTLGNNLAKINTFILQVKRTVATVRTAGKNAANASW